MTESQAEQVIRWLEVLNHGQICDLADCLSEYSIVMDGGDRPNHLEAALLRKTMTIILTTGRQHVE